MNHSIDGEVTLRDPNTGHRLAKVTLNKEQTQIINRQHLLRGFQMIQGNLIHAWSLQQRLFLCVKNGQAIPVRIAAMPHETDGMGLIEFLH